MLLGELSVALEEDLRTMFSVQLLAELKTLDNEWSTRLAHFTNSVYGRLQYAQAHLRDVWHDWENAMVPEFPFMETRSSRASC